VDEGGVSARAVDLIRRKRDGEALTEAELSALVGGLLDGRVADYQMAAFLMAVVWRGMTQEETAALTRVMRDSGRVVDLSSVPGVKVDKHSTGGVGDKVSLVLAPLVAAAGVPVPMVSGRGLGHTGGTLDKLEAIPGFRTDLSLDRFVEQVGRLRCALIGQTAEMAPADRRLYALRDVTATVESIPLITASILSKKLAEGIDGLVLDVKVGRGAFMRAEPEARRLAEALVGVAREAGLRAVAVLTDMDQPLGLAVGNALETWEVVRVLRGERGPGLDEVREVTLVLGGWMLVLAGAAADPGEGAALLAELLDQGAGLEAFRGVIEAQGGDPRVVDDPVGRLPRAPAQRPVPAPASGVVAGINAFAVGQAAMRLGAGRARAEDPIDPAVGVVLAARRGDAVQAGAPLGAVHGRDAAGAEAAARAVAAAFEVAPAGTAVVAPPLVRGVLGGAGER
jgi:pyrimidine-nucleoside phosphorylase